MYAWINILVSFYSNRFPCNISPKIFIVSDPSLYGKNSSSFLNTAVIPDKSIIQSEVVWVKVTQMYQGRSLSCSSLPEKELL